MRYLLLSILFFQFLLANENNITNVESIFKQQAEIQAIIDDEFPKKEYNETIIDDKSYASKILLNKDIEFNSNSFRTELELSKQDLFKEAQIDEQFTTQQTSKYLYAKYVKIPKIVFKNQRFEIVLKATITTDEFDKIETRFIDFKNVSILNHENEWKYGGQNNFYNKYYIKVKSDDFTMPTLQILMYKQNKVFEIITLNPKEFKYTTVAINNEKFTNLIAKDLEIVTHKTKQYTNNKLLTIFELKANQGNLEDFYLKDFKEQGISSIEQDGSSQSAIFYAIIPLHVKRIVFDYYNSKSNSFVRMQSSVILKNELVSTQTDLNPNKSNILLYKKVFFGFFVLLFFILYLIRKRFIYIFCTLVFLIIFILYNLPNEMIKIKDGSNIYILPTDKSTVFYKINTVQKVEVLNKKDNFLKVFFKKANESEETIGWIKENNIVEN